MFSIAIIIFIFSVIFSIFFNLTEKKVKFLNYGLIIAFMLLFGKSISVLFNITNTEFFVSNLIHIWQLEAFFMLIFSIVWISILFYSNFYNSFLNKNKLNYYTLFFTLFLTSMLWVIVVNEAFSFLVCWEIMSLSSYFLVIHESSKEESRISWIWYLVLTHIWMFFILASFFPFIMATWSTFFSDWNHVALSTSAMILVFVGSLVWFGWKSWLFPLHIWLPKAHPIAPSNISALMSGFMVKLPVFMLIKFYLFFMSVLDIRFAYVLLILWGITAFWWIFNAIIQNNIKKFLAYSTIENIGFIYVWLWIIVAWISTSNNSITTIGIIATLFHTFNHSIYKTMMFSLAWSLIERTHHNYDYSKLWWIAKIMPIFTIFFLISTISISWIPPLNGFNSELTMYLWLINLIISWTNHVLSLVWLTAFVLVWLMSVLAFIWFTKLFSIIFLWNARDEKIKVETKWNFNEYVSYIILTLAILVLSFTPWIITLLSSKIFSFIEAPSNLVTVNIGNVLYIPLFIFTILLAIWLISYYIYKNISWKEEKMDVWNCWYPYLVKKSQYRAESLIQAIRRLYKWIYSEKNTITHVSKVDWKVYYKKYLSSINYERTYFLKIHYLFWKVIDFVLYISNKLKSMQDWVLQHYVSYMLITLILTILYIIVY